MNEWRSSNSQSSEARAVDTFYVVLMLVEEFVAKYRWKQQVLSQSTRGKSETTTLQLAPVLRSFFVPA